jgi:hypothetical protein
MRPIQNFKLQIQISKVTIWIEIRLKQRNLGRLLSARFNRPHSPCTTAAIETLEPETPNCFFIFFDTFFYLFISPLISTDNHQTIYYASSKNSQNTAGAMQFTLFQTLRLVSIHWRTEKWAMLG